MKGQSSNKPRNFPNKKVYSFQFTNINNWLNTQHNYPENKNTINVDKLKQQKYNRNQPVGPCPGKSP